MKEREWTCKVADTPLAALPPRPPFQHFGETRRLAAPFVATAARFAIDERTLLPFTNDSQASKAMNIAEGVRRGVAREETAAQHDCGV